MGEEFHKLTTDWSQSLKDRFEIIEELGRGAGGLVLRVRDRKHQNKEIALKILLNDTAFDQATIERFKKEWELCSKVRHGNLIEAYDFVDLGTALGFTMEYVEGRDLAEILQAKRPNHLQIFEIIRQTLSALAALHAVGVIHRDIKLENVFLRNDGMVKLIDLGLMRKKESTSNLTGTGILLRTAQYMPPEYVNHGRYDERSDIYALGFVMYELLTGTRWLSNKTGVAALEYLTNVGFKVPMPVEYRDKNEQFLWELTKRALSPKPRARFESAVEMSAHLNGFHNKQEVKNSTTKPQASVTPENVPPFKAGANQNILVVGFIVFAVFMLGALFVIMQ